MFHGPSTDLLSDINKIFVGNFVTLRTSVRLLFFSRRYVPFSILRHERLQWTVNESLTLTPVHGRET